MNRAHGGPQVDLDHDVCGDVDEYSIDRYIVDHMFIDGSLRAACGRTVRQGEPTFMPDLARRRCPTCTTIDLAMDAASRRDPWWHRRLADYVRKKCSR